MNAPFPLILLGGGWVLNSFAVNGYKLVDIIVIT